VGSKRRSRSHDGADESRHRPSISSSSAGTIAFEAHHRHFLRPHNHTRNAPYRRLDWVAPRSMKPTVQILTTPTADTPGTTLILQFDNKRYLIGSLAEGTQRACVQMKTHLIKVSEVFMTGRAEWRNTGGLIGMILTLADSTASSAAASKADAQKRAANKMKNQPADPQKMRELVNELRKDVPTTLNLFGPPNLNHTLATARRFVFRKGMPVNVHEVDECAKEGDGEDEWAPYWADENVKVWAMSILPKAEAETNGSLVVKTAGTISPRKRSLDEAFEGDVEIQPAERDQLTVKAVVGEMFNSAWHLDTLYETPLNQVQLPAAIFIRDKTTNKIQPYDGPLPGQALKPNQQPLEDPSMTVLVRKPWPGALVKTLPETQPKLEAVSYIFRNHTQRGKFDTAKAEALKVEKGPKFSALARGESVLNANGETVTPEQVLGATREGGGFAVLDIPGPEYIEPVLARPEWREQKVMTGVGAMVWICGPGVVEQPAVKDFMNDFQLQHIISSPELCPNNIALDSAANTTVRLAQIAPDQFVVPQHSNEPSTSIQPLNSKIRRAVRGLTVELEPSISVEDKTTIAPLDIEAVAAETSPEVLELATKSQDTIEAARSKTIAWANSLPTNAAESEVVTLGTGSALPSKYRNVSATLLRHPGWGSMLFDCGENTLGQLKRVYGLEGVKEVLRDLRMIVISHMHADHHLGTVGIIKAWYEEVHDLKPLNVPDAERKDTYDMRSGLAVVAEPAMIQWLAEYRAVEDYGWSRLAPLNLSARYDMRSRLGWFIPPSRFATVENDEMRDRLLDAHAFPASRLGLHDIQAVQVQHCHGARAVSITFQSGFKASYSGDCRPSKAFARIGKGSTVCIHEATFDDELLGDAKAKNHSTTSEALGVAQAMGAKACVLTHFSQRYQKLPVLDRDTAENGEAAESDVDMDESTNPEDTMDAPLEDVAATVGGFDDHAHKWAERNQSAAEAVKIKLTRDMKVAVAFDYMRIKIGEIPHMEHYVPPLLKLFEDEDGASGQVGKGKKNKKNEAGKKKNNGQ
jgi:ribonuclease Z